MSVENFFSHDRYATYAGVKITHIETGYARAELPVSDVVLNASGSCHGGAMFTLADMAFAAAVNTHGVVTVSVNASIVFLKDVRQGTLYAEARELFDHHRLPFAEVRITDDNGDLVALFTSSGYRKKHCPLPSDDEL